MTKISTSPDRGTFSVKSHIKSAAEKNTEPDNEYLDLLASHREQRALQEQDPAWQKDNLEYDLRTTDWILEKVRTNPVYAQNLYAALCNNDFQKADVMPILTDQLWHCSWRYAGGIIAHMRQEGDYIDWYCSGYSESEGVVSEATVTDEVRDDFGRLGWIVIQD
jgi:hypothetical protein